MSTTYCCDCAKEVADLRQERDEAVEKIKARIAELENDVEWDAEEELDSLRFALKAIEARIAELEAITLVERRRGIGDGLRFAIDAIEGRE